MSVPFTKISASSPLKLATEYPLNAVSASARMAEFADACAITNTSLESITAFEVNVLVKLPPLPLRYTVYPLNEIGALDGL